MMKSREFGNTGIYVPEVGFGAWAIGGKGWGSSPDDENAWEALEVSWDQGVRLFDTCDAYGDGHSENLLGKFLKGKRQEAVIVTKGGTNFRVPERSKNFEREYLFTCLEESLRRLQTDYTDVYLLHVPDAAWQEKGRIWDTLKAMKQSGKVRFAGLAMWGAGDTLHALSQDEARVMEVLECPFNILNKSNIEVVEIARERGIAVLTSQPLASGILTGKYAAGAGFPEGDNRKGFWTGERFKDVAPDMEIIRACMAETGLNMAQLSLAYNLNYPGISCVIPGAKNREQALSNISSSGIALNEAVMEQLKKTRGFVF